MRYRVFFAALAMTILILVQAPIGAQTTNGTAPQDMVCKAQKDEIEIFASFLKDKSLRQVPTVLVNVTEATDAGIDHSADRLLAVNGYKIPSELRNDLKSRNKSNCTIGTLSGVKNLSFISEAEKVRLLLAGESEIQERYGPGTRFIAFSRVAFNSDKTLALFQVSFFVNHDGDAILYVLERKGRRWVITMNMETPISPKTTQP